MLLTTASTWTHFSLATNAPVKLTFGRKDMSGIYNITPGYDLAQRTAKSVYGLTGYFDYPGSSYLCDGGACRGRRKNGYDLDT